MKGDPLLLYNTASLAMFPIRFMDSLPNDILSISFEFGFLEIVISLFRTRPEIRKAFSNSNYRVMALLT